MAISGLVVTVCEGAAGDAAAGALAADKRVTIGPRFGDQIAIVAETLGVQADRELCEALRAIPGVRHVDVSFIHLDLPGDSNPGAHGEAQHAHA